MFVLDLLGSLSLRGDAAPVPAPAQQKRTLGLLAMLALGGRNNVSRSRIEAYLWPESGDGAARHSLDQTVYACRRALGSDALLSSGRELRLNPDLFRVDVWTFDDAVRKREWAAAVEQYKGVLLDGVHLADSRELEAWVDVERTRRLGDYQSAVEHLAGMAERAGDHAQRVAWCRRLANSEPLSARATRQLMLALVASGDRAGAVRQARVHQQLVRQQLEMEPDREIEELAASVSRAGPRSSPTASGTPELSSGHGVRAETAPPLPPPSAPASGRRPRSTTAVLLALTALLIGAAVVGSRRDGDGAPSAVTTSSPPAGASRSTPARTAYLRALDAWGDGSRSGLDTAVAYFNRAIALHPGYAEAYAGLADAYVMLGYFGYHSAETMFPRAKAAAIESLRLDSTLAAPHPALAYALTWERDFVNADAEFRRAVASAPPSGVASAAASNGAPAATHQWHPVILMLLAQKPEVAAAAPAGATASTVAPDPFSLHVPVVELTFTKWIDDYPAMNGFTSDGPGTMTGAILSRIDDGTMTHLVARYELADPTGRHWLKTVVQGAANDSVGTFHMNGVVAWGWMTGAHVHATFQRISPCPFGRRNACFRGTIQLRPR